MKRFWIVGVIMILSVAVVPAGMAVAATSKRVASLKSSNDSDARGRAVLRIDPAAGRVCFRITFEGTSMNPTYGSIDRGYGYAAQHELQLFNNDEGPHSSPIEGCVRDAERALLREVKEHPRRFWVDMFQYATDNELHGRIRTPR